MNRPCRSRLRRLSAFSALLALSLLCLAAYPATVTADDDRVAVLMYHQFSQREHDITIAPERFRAQLRALKAAGYTFINPIKFAAFLDGAVNLTGKNVLITIDDGYQGVYDHALQVLLDEHVPALSFLIAKQVDTPIPGAASAQIGPFSCQSPRNPPKRMRPV